MNVIAVVAHPDDELMCAGTLARFAAEAHDVTEIIWCESEPESNRAMEAANAAEVLGGDYYVELAQFCTPDDELTFDRRLVSSLDDWIDGSDIVISHRPTDTNQTHATLGQAVRASCRKNNRTLWQLDQSIPGGWDATAPRPNHLVNITDHIHTKAAAIDCYKSQIERYGTGWPEAITARDQFYGWMLAQGDGYITHAEGFIVEKSVWL